MQGATVQLADQLEPYWESGHWFFETPESSGSRIHTDTRINVYKIAQDDRLRREIIQRLTGILLEAKPDYLIDCTGYPFQWMSYVAGELTEKLGHQVYVIDSWNTRNFRSETGKAIIFVDVLTLGIEPFWGLEIAKQFGLEPTGLVTIVDRSPFGTVEWEAGSPNNEKLSVGALYRRPTKIWPIHDCPQCQGSTPFTGSLNPG